MKYTKKWTYNKRELLFSSGAKIGGVQINKTINISYRPFNWSVGNFAHAPYMKMTHYVKLIVTKKKKGRVKNIFKQKSKKADISN